MNYFRVFLKAPIFEDMLCYAINSEEAKRIDPQPDRYLDSGPEKTETLSAGQYYITQIRKEQVENSELTDMAMELQKEGLWVRLKLENKLYVRSFSEDGHPVLQLWRKICQGTF